MNEREYNALPGIRSSQLKTTLELGPAAALAPSTGDSDSPSKRLGRLVHLYALEPETAGARVLVAPDVDRRTKAGKDAWEAFAATVTADHEVASAEEIAQAQRLASGVRAEIRRLAGSRTVLVEQPIEWDADGMACKCKPDALIVYHGDAVIVDIKTTRESLYGDSLSRASWNWRYDLQVAHYTEGVGTVYPVAGFWFVFVQVETGEVAALEIDAQLLDRGQTDRRRALDAIAAYQRGDTATVNSALRKPTILSLPAYAVR